MTALIGPLLLLAGALVGLRLLAGLDAKDTTLHRLVGLALVALFLPPLLAAVESCADAMGGGAGSGDTARAAVAIVLLVAGVVVAAGVLRYVRHRHALDAWLRRPATSRKQRVE